jgi:hypothetical protein
VVNLSGKVGYEEARWGYDALREGRIEDAIRWLKMAQLLIATMAGPKTSRAVQ